jgi:PAS domain S-box-containing protein
MLKAEVLGQLLLMQNILINLPDRKSIFSFVCRGLIDVPGIESVTCEDEVLEVENDSILNFVIGKNEKKFGVLSLKIKDLQEFKPYEQYVRNFIFMIEVILEEQQQRALNILHQAELEERVAERTKELSDEMEERRIVSESLKQSEALFRASFENTAAGVCLINTAGEFMKVNETFCNILGYSENELIGKNFNDITYPDDKIIGQSVVNDLIENKIDKVDFEKRYIHKNGKIILAFVSMAIVRNVLKEPKFFITYIQDITDQKRTQLLLLHSEQKYRSLFENMSTGFAFHEIIYDENGGFKDYRYLEVNPAYEKLTGLKSEDVVGKTVKEVVPEIEQYWIDTFGKVAKTGEPTAYANFVRKFNKYYDTWIFCPEKDKFAVLFTDITERKLAEQELIIAKARAEESELTFRKLFEDSADAILLIDSNGVFVECNHAALNLMQMSREQFLFLPPVKISPEYQPNGRKSEEAAIEMIELAYEKGLNRFDWTCVNSKGDEFIVEVSLMPISIKGETMLHTTWRDITKRKQDEVELQNAKQKAEESDQLKTAFLQNMSHEIRTPLNAISGFVGMLNKPDLSDDKRKSFVSIIQNSSKQLVSIVTDILTISSLETRQEKLNIDKVCINNIIVDLLSIFKPQAQTQNISLYAKQQLSDKQSEIHTDKTKITQILSNLLSNALKFTHHGFVEFGYNLKENELEFYVKDSGIGISPEFHLKIFERFRQANQSINKLYGGTGLGLAISKAFAELLGGKIWVESELEKGSIFYFTVPYGPVDKGNTSIKVTKQNDNFKTVLVAEDDEYNFLFIEEMLIGMDLKLIHTKDGKETVEIFKANPNIDMILMDIKMPIMTGDQAAKIIKEISPDFPIIAQSAYGLEHEQAKYSGIFDDYITKPISENDFKQIIMKYIDIKE